MFSQNEEEKHILEYFDGQPAGRFLDIGAYNGKTFSNTHALALNGWSGVCIEPSSKPFSDLVQLYRDNDKIDLVNVAVMPDTERILELWPLYDAGGDAISTLSEEHKKKWEKDRNYRKTFIQPVHMSAIEKVFGYEFEFINIDVEGMNFDVAMGMTFEKTQMLCIEHDGDKYRTQQLCDVWGFEVVYRNGENVLLARPKSE
jgi:FkbM family methyltransferase